MYYEENIIEGKLHFKTHPSGEWRLNETAAAQIVNAMFALSDEERMDVMRNFCSHCGTAHLPCHCWNDE